MLSRIPSILEKLASFCAVSKLLSEKTKDRAYDAS
jgi:hypothetical protein